MVTAKSQSLGDESQGRVPASSPPAAVSDWPRPRLSSAVAIVMGLSIPVVAGLMWWMRRRSFETGLPCEARGPYGCSYDENLAAVYGAIVGTGFLIGALAVHFFARRFSGFRFLAPVIGAVWLVCATLLLDATGS